MMALLAGANASGNGMLRYMSSAPSVVDQMIAYARGLKGQERQAADILRSGLGMQADPAAGEDSSRLLLALSEVAANQNQWAEAAEYAERAASAASSSSSGTPQSTPSTLVQAAKLLQIRALLVTGADDEAKQAVEAVAAGTAASQHPAPLGCSLAVQQALCDSARQTTAQQLQVELADFQPANVLDAWALSALAHHELSQGEHDAAAKHYGEAASTASAASEAAANAEQQPELLTTSVSWEIEADALLGQAQVSIAGKQWEAAERQLGDGLSAAERAGGEGSPRLVPALLLLGHVYARSARVMYAEGMLREAAKLAHLDPIRATVAQRAPCTLHTSLKSALAWRYCQLLTALPRRSSEAAAWGELARGLWSQSGCLAQTDIAAVLGDDVALKGQGSWGQGGIVSPFLRRMLS